MKKISTILMLYLLACASMPIPRARGIAQEPESVEKWFENLPNATEKLIKLHFYFHDTVSGNNPSAITVAEANITLTSPTFFGLLRVMDNPLTMGPELCSEIIGRAQGIYGSASIEEEWGLLMTLNFVFTYGDYNGSTLAVVGHNPILHKYREMPIVGGSGLFRLARGIATAKTVWFNLTTQDAVVEYHVMVLYYDSI